MPSLRRHDIRDDPIIERIARDADARMRQRMRDEAPALALETQDREIAGAAAEIRDQHRLVALQPARIPIGCAERLVCQPHLRQPGIMIGLLQTRDRQIFVRPLAGENDGPPADQRQVLREIARVAEQMGEKGRDQALDRETLAIEPRLAEERARQMRLDRLDEPLLTLGRNGALKRLRPGDMFHRAAFAPEHQGGAKGLRRPGGARPSQGFDMPVPSAIATTLFVVPKSTPIATPSAIFI